MASIIPTLTTYLLAESTVTNIVGTNIKSGSISPKNKTPYIIIKRVDADYSQDLAGAADFVKTTLSIDCVSNTYAEADDLFEQVRLILDSYQQTLMGTFWINSVKLTNRFDIDPDKPEANNQKWTYTQVGIFDISYPVTDPTV